MNNQNKENIPRAFSLILCRERHVGQTTFSPHFLRQNFPHTLNHAHMHVHKPKAKQCKTRTTKNHKKGHTSVNGLLLRPHSNLALLRNHQIFHSGGNGLAWDTTGHPPLRSFTPYTSREIYSTQLSNCPRDLPRSGRTCGSSVSVQYHIQFSWPNPQLGAARSILANRASPL